MRLWQRFVSVLKETKSCHRALQAVEDPAVRGTTDEHVLFCLLEIWLRRDAADVEYVMQKQKVL
jgi:hypothetical protein